MFKLGVLAQAPYPGRSPAACLIMYSQSAINSRFKKKKSLMAVFAVVGGFFFSFQVVGDGYKEQVSSSWCPGQPPPVQAEGSWQTPPASAHPAHHAQAPKCPLPPPQS